MTLDRQTHRLVTEIFTVLERHGYHQHDHEHTNQAITMAVQLARIYDGTLDTPASAAQHPQPEPGSEPDPDALVLAGTDISTVLAALSLAAEYKRDLAETCADCADQSCPTCQYRLKDAQGYDRLSDRIYYGAEPADRPQPEPDGAGASLDRADPDAGKEAGQ